MSTAYGKIFTPLESFFLTEFACIALSEKKLDMRVIRTITIYFALLSCLVTGCRCLREKITKDRLSGIDAAVKEEIQEGNVPGAVILIGQADKIFYHKSFGYEVIEPYREKMTKNTVFDVASLTKPIATATSIMVLMDRQKLKLADYVATYLPTFASNGKDQVQISHLLSHTSGLPAYTSAGELKKQFSSPCPEKVIEKICGLAPLNKPGEEFRYSCLGYIILAKIVEVVSGESIDDFAKENIFEPLKMKHTAYNPPQAWEKNIAATQIVDEKLLRGTVHDPLAQLMAGKSGNAGLFSTAYDLSIYCRMLLNNGTRHGKKILSPQAVTLLTTTQSHGRAFGFDVSSSYSWPKGTIASEKAFCHAGYTGTAIVCDPESKIFIIILTNRVHPHDKGTTKPLCRKIADEIFQAYK
jgi:CubicO group peptidase (beta-lactamase class C family)